MAFPSYCFCGTDEDDLWGINHTFHNKHTAKSDEVYINVITPKGRDLQGPLVVFDSSGVLFKTHSLARGSNSNRLKAGGNGDTPTGKTSTWYEKKHIGDSRYGNHGLIYLHGIEGDFKVATKNGRSGIAIHGGHTTNYRGQIVDTGKLFGTYGCVRVYNEKIKELVALYNDLKNQGKKIYCYIEDYDGDIKDVYKFYKMKVDAKDSSRGKRYSHQ